MHISRLGLVGRVVLALLAVFAVAAVASATAVAEAPHWTVEGSKLNSGETEKLTAKAHGNPLKLSVPGLGQTITCPKVKVKPGATINGGEPGTSVSIDEFEECTQTGNGKEPGCKVEGGKITTREVVAELVMNTELTHYLLEFRPKEGEEFVTIKYEGTGCLLKTAPVKGFVLGSIYTDPEAGGPTEPELTGPSTPEYTSYLIKFPDEPTAVWLWNSPTEHTELKGEKGKLLTFAGKEATLEGEVLVLLENGKKFGAAG